MYEFSLAHALLYQVQQIAQRENAAIRSLDVTIGNVKVIREEKMMLERVVLESR